MRFIRYKDSSGEINTGWVLDDQVGIVDGSIFDTSYSLLGEIDGRRMLAILNEYTLAFFDKFLKGIDSQVLQPDRPGYPEINAVCNDMWMDMDSQ